MTLAHTLGFPRIGLNRQAKKTVEAYWRGELDQAALFETQKNLQSLHWQWQQDVGLDFVAVGDFSWYDHVLDLAFLLGVVPERFESDIRPLSKLASERKVGGGSEHRTGVYTPVHEDLSTEPTNQFPAEVEFRKRSIDTYFCMARGRAPNGLDAPACEMTKWFDTNYHYIVPELTKDQIFTLTTEFLFDAVQQAHDEGFKTKPVVLGPLSFLWLSKTKGEDFNKLDLLPRLLSAYTQIFEKLKALGVEWVQIDEPILCLDLPSEWQAAFRSAYETLDFSGLKALFATYFGELRDNLALVCALPVDGLHIDAVRGESEVATVIEAWPNEKVLSLGVVNGRNIWKVDYKKALALLEKAKETFGDNLWVATSCSLLHSPIDLDAETKLGDEIKNWLAFAKQKLLEVATLKKALKNGIASIEAEFADNQNAWESRRSSTRIHDAVVKNRVSNITPEMAKRDSEYRKRAVAQREKLHLPLLPTTTIGSFPQTKTIRKVRADFKKGAIDQVTYEETIRAEIAEVVKIQEKLGLDVLVHGEAERNDMVEYFGELFEGVAFKKNGWVQSYGSRCVKPPIIFGDVSRPEPMTVRWSQYAQSLTPRPMKGMLTGPVTILAWSFVRDDQPDEKTAEQLALALRDEVKDLEAAGIGVIQVDEPAFRETLPLRRNDWQHYLDWAVRCFRLSTCGISDATQIHTHMCYSEFNDIIESIAALDADVITLESSRSDMELLAAFEKFDYPNEIGPGVYDIHSPRVPTQAEMESLLIKALQHIPAVRLWVNPDCGLKTRGWAEVKEALTHMVNAAKKLRASFEIKKNNGVEQVAEV